MIEVVASCGDQGRATAAWIQDLTLSGLLLSFNLILGCDLPVLMYPAESYTFSTAPKADARLGSPSVRLPHPLPSSKAKYLRHPTPPVMPRKLQLTSGLRFPRSTASIFLEPHAQPGGHDHDRQPINGLPGGIGTDDVDLPYDKFVDIILIICDSGRNLPIFLPSLQIKNMTRYTNIC